MMGLSRWWPDGVLAHGYITGRLGPAGQADLSKVATGRPGKPVVEGILLLLANRLEVLLAAQDINKADRAFGLPEADRRPVVTQPPGRLDDGLPRFDLQAGTERLHPHDRPGDHDLGPFPGRG
jgi:hypothetical protein